MITVLVCLVFALTLASKTLASDNVFLYTEDHLNNILLVEYGRTPTVKSLKLDFYEGCIDTSSSVCKKKQKGNESYVRQFSQSEKRECLDYEQVAESMNDVLGFCIDMENSHWYGGAENTYQYWPLNKLNWTDNAYVTKEADGQAVVESYFFNSDGFYVHVDESVPLFVDINGPRPGHMCFAAKVTGPYRRRRNAMRFRACKYRDPRAAHENAVRDVLGAPTSIPDPHAVQYPIWSTWARYKADVNTSVVRDYAREIVENGFPRGTIEIDDKWETCYGSAEFDTSRFGNVKELTRELKLQGFKTSLWTHPFINLDCKIHETVKSKGYFVNSTKNTVNSVWWNGNASYIDFTNPEAATWWSNNLRELLAKSGVDTLKFDAGESSWSPSLPNFHDNDFTYYPDNIVNAYLKTVVTFGNAIEYRSSRRSQQFGYFLRMMDRESRWDFKLGLPTLVTALIQLNMIGYPFVLPDMIGGNGYNNEPPSKEMYIRWMEASVFMPVVQFSYTPWDFDQQTIKVCKYFMDLRSNYTDTIIKAMRNTVGNGSPVNPPIWWIDPTNSEAHSIADEYLLGESILVAPVLVEHATHRNIYLPAGLWRDENHPDLPAITGRVWLLKYPATLEVLPWFTKVGDQPAPYSSNSITLWSSAIFTFALVLIVNLCR